MQNKLFGTIPESAEFEECENAKTIIRDVIDLVPDKIPLDSCEKYIHYQDCSDEKCSTCAVLQRVFADPGRIFFQKWNCVTIYGDGANIIIQGNGILCKTKSVQPVGTCCSTCCG